MAQARRPAWPVHRQNPGGGPRHHLRGPRPSLPRPRSMLSDVLGRLRPGGCRPINSDGHILRRVSSASGGRPPRVSSGFGRPLRAAVPRGCRPLRAAVPRGCRPLRAALPEGCRPLRAALPEGCRPLRAAVPRGVVRINSDGHTLRRVSSASGGRPPRVSSGFERLSPPRVSSASGGRPPRGVVHSRRVESSVSRAIVAGSGTSTRPRHRPRPVREPRRGLCDTRRSRCKVDGGAHVYVAVQRQGLATRSTSTSTSLGGQFRLRHLAAPSSAPSFRVVVSGRRFGSSFRVVVPGHRARSSCQVVVPCPGTHPAGPGERFRRVYRRERRRSSIACSRAGGAAYASFGRCRSRLASGFAVAFPPRW